jgi:hypothetical protein
MKLHELNLVEADEDDEKKKKTKQKDQDRLDPNSFNAPKYDPLVPRDDDKQHPSSEPPKSHRTVSKQQTHRATGNIPMNRQAVDHLRNLHTNVPSDNEPEPTDNLPVPHQAEHLPAIISKQLRAAGSIDPDFHLVANLPGNMSSAIRQLGKSLFGALTKTPTDKISMIGNLNGHGPNSNKEIQAVAQYLKKHGKNLGPGNIDFDRIMPGYKADIHNFSAGGIHYMMVKDFMGEYIYSWPETSTIVHQARKELK